MTGKILLQKGVLQKLSTINAVALVWTVAFFSGSKQIFKRVRAENLFQDVIPGHLCV